jgi:hypothetical protein
MINAEKKEKKVERSKVIMKKKVKKVKPGKRTRLFCLLLFSPFFSCRLFFFVFHFCTQQPDQTKQNREKKRCQTQKTIRKGFNDH